MFSSRYYRAVTSLTRFSVHQQCLHALPPPSRQYASVSTVASQTVGSNLAPQKSGTVVKSSSSERPFQRLPTVSLVRSIILARIFTTPLLYKPGLYILERLAHSRSVWLDPDRNPIIGAMTLPLFYRHLCAGRNATEVRRTIADMKKIGYSGVILCYSGEIIDAKNVKIDGISVGGAGSAEAHADRVMQYEIDAWKKAQLATLEAVGEGNYVGIKYTGAGTAISKALKEGKLPPPAMLEAIHTICDRARLQKTQIWIDAEQQVYHPTIDNWTIDLMRKYNRDDDNDGNVLVLATVQAYLKTSRQTVERYLRLAAQAQEEGEGKGWTLGIKLVRGAYIGSEIRSRIHDTKADTDASYDGIAHDLICRDWPGFDNNSKTQSFPNVQLFLAGHNTASIRKAYSLVQKLATNANQQQQQQQHQIRYGQSQGIADDVGCELLALRDQITRDHKHHNDGVTANTPAASSGPSTAPAVYKCLIWGSLKQCLHFLIRRAVENHGAADRLTSSLPEMRRELRGRIFKKFQRIHH